ncbi:MAG: hypothetical protein OEV44_07780 [Spirochaetota bacterium]|nr:hypothetical protein [Spirochaetota bacterium]
MAIFPGQKQSSFITSRQKKRRNLMIILIFTVVATVIILILNMSGSPIKLGFLNTPPPQAEVMVSTAVDNLSGIKNLDLSLFDEEDGAIKNPNYKKFKNLRNIPSLSISLEEIGRNNPFLSY